jgi:hypothetical protein
MMKTKSIVQSERQRPRAVEIMKDIYASHVADKSCGLGANCPVMISLKNQIAEEERLINTGSNFSRSFGLK